MVLGGVSRDIVPRRCLGCSRGDEGEGLLVGDTLATLPLGFRGLLSLKKKLQRQSKFVLLLIYRIEGFFFFAEL